MNIGVLLKTVTNNGAYAAVTAGAMMGWLTTGKLGTRAVSYGKDTAAGFMPKAVSNKYNEWKTTADNKLHNYPSWAKDRVVDYATTYSGWNHLSPMLRTVDIVSTKDLAKGTVAALLLSSAAYVGLQQLGGAHLRIFDQLAPLQLVNNPYVQNGIKQAFSLISK